MEKKDLKDYRKKLDEIDRCMVELFEKRMHLAEEIGKYKKERQIPVLDREREEEKLAAVRNLVEDPALKEEACLFYEYLMERSRAVQNISVK